MIKAIIYVQDHCRFCDRAKELLDLREISFGEVNVTGDIDRKREMVDRSGRSTTPQIFVMASDEEAGTEVHIGGCDDLFALDKNGQLNDQLLALVKQKAV